jgi:hypothetical protein
MGNAIKVLGITIIRWFVQWLLYVIERGEKY